MEYLYPFARLPGGDELKQKVSAAAVRLEKKLMELDISKCDVSDYTKRYFTTQREEVESTLHKFTFIMLWLLQGKEGPLERETFMEYGGGTGILSLYAKELGWGKVYYTDIYDVSCRDAEVIGRELRLPSDAYILGDIDEVLEYVRNHGIHCTAVASNDVIEHIYDVEDHLRKIQHVSDGNVSLAILTTANMFNIINVRKVMKKQYRREKFGSSIQYGHKQRDAKEAYLSIRRRLIAKYAPDLDVGTLDQLASNTRGLMVSGIKAAVDNYRRTGAMIEAIPHPTNTCDPYTGNWCEHLMDPFELSGIMRNCDLKSSVVAGYYYVRKDQHLVERAGRRAMNLTIGATGRYGLRIAPMWMLHAIRKSGKA